MYLFHFQYKIEIIIYQNFNRYWDNNQSDIRMKQLRLQNCLIFILPLSAMLPDFFAVLNWNTSLPATWPSPCSSKTLSRGTSTALQFSFWNSSALCHYQSNISLLLIAFNLTFYFPVSILQITTVFWLYTEHWQNNKKLILNKVFFMDDNVL